MEPGQGITAGSLVGVGVDLQGRADPGMAQDRLRIASWHLQILEQRPDGMAQVVDLDSPDAVVVADAPEGPNKVARFNRVRWRSERTIVPSSAAEIGGNEVCYAAVGLDRGDDRVATRGVTATDEHMGARPASESAVALPMPLWLR